MIKTQLTSSIYLLQVNNRSTGKGCEICSKLTTKTPLVSFWLIVNLFLVNASMLCPRNIDQKWVNYGTKYSRMDRIKFVKDKFCAMLMQRRTYRVFFGSPIGTSNSFLNVLQYWNIKRLSPYFISNIKQTQAN